LRHDDEFWHIKAKITDQRLNPKSPSYIKVDGYEDIYGKEFEGIYYVFKTDCVFNNVKQFLKYKNYTDDLFNRK
jgi:hypothetical protein